MKRMVVFLDAGADGSDGGQVSFIMPGFDAPPVLASDDDVF